MNWHFLHKMGFGERWIKWILRCISIASVSVLVNDSLSPKFHLERGLRQGCPILTLLFNIVVESFFILVTQLQDKRWLEDISIPGLTNRITVL